jgi:hypothetical protein
VVAAVVVAAAAPVVVVAAAPVVVVAGLVVVVPGAGVVVVVGCPFVVVGPVYAPTVRVTADPCRMDVPGPGCVEMTWPS